MLVFDSYKHIIRFIVYASFFGLIFFNIGGYYFFFLYLLFGLIFVDCNNRNIRELVGLYAISVFVLYEVGTFLMYFTTEVYPTGSVVGEIILNIHLLLHFFFVLIILYFRDTILSPIYNFFGIADFSKVYQKADWVLIKCFKYQLVFIVVFCCFQFYLASIYYEFWGALTPIEKNDTLDKFTHTGYILVQGLSYIGTVKMFILTLFVIPWSKKSAGSFEQARTRWFKA